METIENNFVLNIKYKGEDYKVVVEDLESANLLLNDASAAYKFIEAQKNNVSKVPKDTDVEDSLLEVESEENIVTEPLATTEAYSNVIWTKNKPTEIDFQATALLLSTRKKMSELFAQKVRRFKLWTEIATTLENNNFNVGQNPGERCRQKFANLRKVYLAYVQRHTEPDKCIVDEKPPFYDEMHYILDGSTPNPVEQETNTSISNEPNHVCVLNVPKPNLVAIKSDYENVIWTRKKPTAIDLEATSLMLSTRESMNTLFDDKKTRNYELWNDIARNLAKNNFNLGHNAGERCRQKFANILKTYLACIKQISVLENKNFNDLPPFFHEMHAIVGDKYNKSSVPKNNSQLSENCEDVDELDMETLEQSSEDSNASMDYIHSYSSNNEPIAQNNPSTSKENRQRYKKVKTKHTPITQQALARELKRDRISRKREFEFFKSHLIKLEDQRERFLDILERSLSNKNV